MLSNKDLLFGEKIPLILVLPLRHFLLYEQLFLRVDPDPREITDTKIPREGWEGYKKQKQKQGLGLKGIY